MNRKKLNIMSIKKHTLSRVEMKNVLAGSYGGGSALCCYCWTPGGFEAWCRSDIWNDCEDICQGIYPAYGSDVAGNWQTGGSDCSSC